MNHRRWPPNGQLTDFILKQFPEGYVGTAIDVGASDGVSINTTYLLEKRHRWTVLSVEANPEFADMLHSQRAFVENCACSDVEGEFEFAINTENPEAYSSLKPVMRRDLFPDLPATWKSVIVPVVTLETLLTRWEFRQLDALCIDTEGTEKDVLAGIDLAKWAPKVIIVECWDAGALDDYLAPFGYEDKWRSVHNDCFVRRDG